MEGISLKYFIYNINELTPQTYNKWYNLMTEEKKSYINHINNKKSQKRSVAGEMLAKATIGKHLNIPPEQIEISQRENEKPYAVNCNIEFNISHCEDIVVCAVHDSPIGIDIERIRPISAKVLKKFFSQAEQEYILGKVPCLQDYDAELSNEQQKRFFEIWTGKEAYLKYTGEGLIKDLANLHFDKSRITTFLKDDYIISLFY